MANTGPQLLARLRRLSRGGRGGRTSGLQLGDVRFDPGDRRIRRGEQNRLLLSVREQTFLEAFLRRPHQVLSREQLLAAAWDLGYEARSNVVDVYVGYLRDKLGATS